MITRTQAEAALMVLVEYINQGPQHRTAEEREREIKVALTEHHSMPTTELAALLRVPESYILEVQRRMAGR
jgi:hypothetical protein